MKEIPLYEKQNQCVSVFQIQISYGRLLFVKVKMLKSKGRVVVLYLFSQIIQYSLIYLPPSIIMKILFDMIISNNRFLELQ